MASSNAVGLREIEGQTAKYKMRETSKLQLRNFNGAGVYFVLFGHAFRKSS